MITTTRPVHVKLSHHFLAQARARELSDAQVLELFRLLTSERIEDVIADLEPGTRAAVALAGPELKTVVLCRDLRDPGVVTVLTVLGAYETACIARRTDTVRRRIP